MPDASFINTVQTPERNRNMKPMQILTNGLIALVALLHGWFLVLEMFLWTKPIGLKTFRQSLEKAQSSAVLAANQGLYNGFLSAGLVWGLVTDTTSTKIFFLTCVIVAGAYGAYSVNKRIFFIQALPALIAIGTILV
jgi:putative membrane protein